METRDINGKILKVGDDVFTYRYGLTKLQAIVDNPILDDDEIVITISDSESTLISIKEYKVKKVRSWEKLAEDAIFVQNACNLSGIIHSFSQVIQEVRVRLEAENKGGNNELHNHPICVLYSNKIASLTNSDLGEAFSEAYNWARDLQERKVKK